jgi:hypothetical protein
LNEQVAALVKKTELTTGGSVALTTRHPLSAKLALTSPTSAGRSVGIVRLRIKGHGVLVLCFRSSFYVQTPGLWTFRAQNICGQMEKAGKLPMEQRKYG